MAGCESPYHANGYCGKHAQRFRRTGNPVAVRRISPADSFWSQVNKSADCWLWTGYLYPGGYGKISSRLSPSGGTSKLAHRVSYELHKGAIGDGLHLDHLCRNRACVNPNHLEPVTLRENVDRGLHGRLRTHCKRGHELPEFVSGKSRGACRTCANELARSRRRNRRGE